MGRTIDALHVPRSLALGSSQPARPGRCSGQAGGRPPAGSDEPSPIDLPVGTGCPMHGRPPWGEDEGPSANGPLRETHRATRVLLEDFSIADVDGRRQLEIEMQRLRQALAAGEDPSGATHHLLGVCLFQLQEYDASGRRPRSGDVVAPPQNRARSPCWRSPQVRMSWPR